jgi:hypothetical protein
MAKFFSTIPELVVPTASSWQTIDLSSYFGTGDTPAGVLLMVENASTSAGYSAGWRCGGATSTATYTISQLDRQFVWVGISATKTIQLYSGNLTNLNFYFVGWVSTAEAYFPTERWYTSIADTGTGYSDIDPSSIIQTGDTPRVFLGWGYRGTTNDYFYGMGIRPNGSTDTLFRGHSPSCLIPFAVSTADGLFEARNDCIGSGTASAMTVSVAGYLKARATLVTVTNAQSMLSPANTNAWVSVADTMTLNGQPVGDILSNVFQDDATWTGPGLFALAGGSSDTPLATARRIPWSSGGLYAADGSGHWPLLRSRVPGRAQSVYAYDSLSSAVTNVLAYAAWTKGNAAPAFVLGGLF